MSDSNNNDLVDGVGGLRNNHEITQQNIPPHEGAGLMHANNIQQPNFQGGSSSNGETSTNATTILTFQQKQQQMASLQLQQQQQHQQQQQQQMQLNGLNGSRNHGGGPPLFNGIPFIPTNNNNNNYMNSIQSPSSSGYPPNLPPNGSGPFPIQRLPSMPQPFQHQQQRQQMQQQQFSPQPQTQSVMQLMQQQSHQIRQQQQQQINIQRPPNMGIPHQPHPGNGQFLPQYLQQRPPPLMNSAMLQQQQQQQHFQQQQQQFQQQQRPSPSFSQPGTPTTPQFSGSPSQTIPNGSQILQQPNLMDILRGHQNNIQHLLNLKSQGVASPAQLTHLSQLLAIYNQLQQQQRIALSSLNPQQQQAYMQQQQRGLQQHQLQQQQQQQQFSNPINTPTRPIANSQSNAKRNAKTRTSEKIPLTVDQISLQTGLATPQPGGQSKEKPKPQFQSQPQSHSQSPSRLQASPAQSQVVQPPRAPIAPPRPRLGPAVNSYGPRLKRGGTSLIISTAPPPEPIKAKKGRFTEEASNSSASSDESGSDDDSELVALKKAAKYKVKSNAAAAKLAATTAAANARNQEIPLYRPSKRTKLLPTTKHNYEKLVSHKLDDRLAGAREVLVPISVEFDLDGFKVQDSFTWNLNEQLITPEDFAEYICNDLGIHAQTYGTVITRSIKSQLDQYKKFFQTKDMPAPADTRTVIRLDITVGKVQLRDRFEWDISSDFLPEEFANQLVKDLHLGGEFVSLIAHSIRDQIHKIKASNDFEHTFAIEKPFRSEQDAKAWSPFVDCGDRGDDDGEEGANDHDRKLRLLRRQQRLNQAKPKQAQKAYSLIPNNDSTASAASSIIPKTDLAPELRDSWRCSHCMCKYSQTNSIMNGPGGEVALCKSCGSYYQQSNELPDHRLRMFADKLSI